MASLSASDGFIAVTASSPDGEDFSESSTLFLGRASGATIITGPDLLDLQRQRLIERERRNPGANVAPDKKLDEALIELEQEGNVARRRPPPRAGLRSRLAAQVEVTGQVQFTDTANRVHPVRGIRVEIWDDDSATANDRLTTVETNDQGEFRATVANGDEDGTGADLYAIAYAIGRYVEVSRYAAAPNGSHPTRSIMSAQLNNVGSGPVDLSITASNDEAQFPNAVAFEIYEAANYLSRYVATLESNSPPSLVTIRYPRLNENGKNTSDSSYYGGGRIRLGLTDGHDWDNIMHEYGHHLQAIYGFSTNPGGSHTGTQNHCKTQPTRSDGLRLAWSESWPTVFAIQAQTSLHLGTLAIPDLADTLYQDTKPGKDLIYNLEVPDIVETKPPSEGQEHALQRVTWDMFDSVDDQGDAGVALSPAQLWAAAKASTSGRFTTFWTALSQPLADPARGRIGDILALHRIGPTTRPIMSAPNGGIPTLRWNALIGCSGGSQMRYQLRFWDPQSGAMILETSFQSGLAFTPSATQMTALFPPGRTRVGWTAVARDQLTPQTGDYFGTARLFDKPN